MIAYLRRSTSGQDDSFDNQAKVIYEAGYEPKYERRDTVSGRHYNGMPEGLGSAISGLRSGIGDGTLIVAHLDRLGRSGIVHTILDEFWDNGWRLIALNCEGADSRTVGGQVQLRMMATIGWMESAQNSKRVRESSGLLKSSLEVSDTISEYRSQGLSYAKIAEALNADEVPTSQGGKQWYPSSVREVFLRRELDED